MDGVTIVLGWVKQAGEVAEGISKMQSGNSVRLLRFGKIARRKEEV
jgi:hypothetical protein